MILVWRGRETVGKQVLMRNRLRDTNKAERVGHGKLYEIFYILNSPPWGLIRLVYRIPQSSENVILYLSCSETSR